MKPGALLVAAAVVVVTNGVVLLEVARNRAGAPVETIQLTERELPLNFQEKENTGVAVRLDWQRFYPFVEDNYSWLDRAKLEALGFDYARAMREPQRPPLPRPAFVALEFNGPAWEKWLNLAQQSTRPSGTSPEMYSRLIPIDVATTPDPLLRKYPDRRRYLVVKGVIQLFFDTSGKRQPPLRPSISQILPGSIHVPPPLSDAAARFAGRTVTQSPRYTLTVSYGRSFEPWLVSIGEPGKN
jgi:hypothetical protein